MKNNNTKSIAKNSLWLALGEGINGILMFVLTVFLARYLGVDGYGKLTFALSFVTLFIIPIDFGLTPLVTRELAGEKKKTKKYLDNLVLIRVFLGIIAFILILLIIQLISNNSEIRNLVYLLGIWTIFQTTTQFFQAIYRAHEKMFYEAITRISHVLILVLISLYFIRNKFDLVSFGWAYAVAAFFTMILAFIFVWKKFTYFNFKLDITFIKNIFKNSWPFALSLLFVSIYYYIDSVMLGIIKSNEEVGLYNAAYKLIVFITIIGSIFSRSVYPIISKLFKKSLNQLKLFLENYSKLMYAIASPIIFGGIALSEPIIKFVYGPEFNESVLAFQILIVAAGMIYISTVYAHSLQICKKQKRHLLGMGLGALINIILNIFLIPYYGIIGAAFTTLVTEVFILVFMYINFYKIIKLHVIKHLYKPLIVSSVMYLVIYYLEQLNLFLLIILGIIIYFFGMLILGGINKYDISIIKGLISSKKSTN